MKMSELFHCSNRSGEVGRSIFSLRSWILVPRHIFLLLLLPSLQNPKADTMVTVAGATTPSIEETVTETNHRPRKNTSKNKSEAPKQNNILLLLTDDQDIALGSFDTASYMPILHEKLRERGVTFEKGGLVHVPICCPSRSSLLTGKYVHHGSLAKNNSVRGDCYSERWKSDEEDHHTLAVHAQASGYTTLYAGKYLNRYEFDSDRDANASVPRGWDYWYGLEGNSRYYNYTIVERSPGDVRLHEHGDRYPEDYLPLVLQEYTLRMLPQLPEPWLAIVAWPTPHGPFTPEPRYSRDYPETTTPKTPSYNASDDSQARKHWLLRQLGAITNATAEAIEAIYKDRLRALRTVDNHVGKLIDYLETADVAGDLQAVTQRGLSPGSDDPATATTAATATATATTPMDRTVVIYTSDNGFQFGQHRLSIDKRHLYEHDVRVPFVIRGPTGAIGSNITLSKETIVSTIDIAPTVLEIVLEGITAVDSTADTAQAVDRLRTAIEAMDGLSFWGFLNARHLDDVSNEKTTTNHDDDPFVQRTDLLISYHGEGNPKCGLSECPAPLDGLWWMPDSYNNTYHCVRTLGKGVATANPPGGEGSHHQRSDTDPDDPSPEDSIYCVFEDDERFVEYYDLNRNPHQLGNDVNLLDYDTVQRFERRLRELLS